jgi:hypothetical protein
MYYPSYELGKEYEQVRLQEAEKERLIQQMKSEDAVSLKAKLLVNLGDLLVDSGLKLKQVATSGAHS